MGRTASNKLSSDSHKHKMKVFKQEETEREKEEGWPELNEFGICTKALRTYTCPTS